MIKIGKADPEVSLPFIWDDVTALVVEYGPEWLRTVHLADVYNMLMAERMDLWCATDDDKLVGALFASWSRHRYEAEYYVNWLAGVNMRKWFTPGMDKIEQYVGLAGGTGLVIVGREKWDKLLKPRGYTPQYMVKKVIHPITGVH